MKKIYYKAFKKDMTCRGFQFKEGETYEVEGKPVLCEHGFHFCKDLVLTLEYYPANDINDNLYAEVQVIGDVKFERPTKHKGVTNKIKILRIIPKSEVYEMVNADRNSGYSNSGNRNSGDWNSGDWNSGDRNSGDSNSGLSNSGLSNSGDWNSGDRNSGDSNSGLSNSGLSNSGNSNSGNSNSGNWNSGGWNACNRETGFFNSKESGWVRVFNKRCSLSKWNSAYKPDFLFFVPDSELTYKESFIKSWESADLKDREKVRELPNFDSQVFYEISGIDLR